MPDILTSLWPPYGRRQIVTAEREPAARQPLKLSRSLAMLVMAL
jgi:hypothetical protein